MYDWQILHRFLFPEKCQGYVLEASPLPKIPVTGLGLVRRPENVFSLDIDHQSREERAINGVASELRCHPNVSRYPFVVFLDGIVSLTRSRLAFTGYLGTNTSSREA